MRYEITRHIQTMHLRLHDAEMNDKWLNARDEYFSR